MGAAPNLLLGESSEPAFYEIKPRRARRCEVNGEARTFKQPGADGSGLVRAVVVHDQVNVEGWRHALIDRVEELAKLSAAVTPVAFSDDRTGLYVQSRKQRGGARAFVIVTAAFRLAWTHGQ